MYLFKTSGATIGSVVANQKHAFRVRPREWRRGEAVLVSKNRADCALGERQIQYVMRLVAIRPLRPSESNHYWPGTEGRWKHLVECDRTQRLMRPFNLSDALGADALPYQPVMTFKRLDPDHVRRIQAYVGGLNPGIDIDD